MPVEDRESKDEGLRTNLRCACVNVFVHMIISVY